MLIKNVQAAMYPGIKEGGEQLLTYLNESDIPLKFFTDTRTHQQENLFIAIEGDSFNPVKFLSNLVDKTFIANTFVIVYNANTENDKIIGLLRSKFSCCQVFPIAVDDTVKYIQWLSQKHRVEWSKQDPNQRKVIGISGSNGKTTTKEMLRQLLEPIFPSRVIATRSNDNNHLGVPFTLLQIKDNTQLAIVELGSNHPGEMQVVTEITMPDYVYVTNIGLTHMEFFPTINDVFTEESFPLKWFYDSKITAKKANSGAAFVNMSDEFLKKYAKKEFFITLGYHPDCHFCVSYSGGDSCSVQTSEGEVYQLVNNNIFGHHNFWNLAASFLIARKYLIDCGMRNKVEDLLGQVKNFQPTFNRSQWINFQGKNIVLDAYNSNPSSLETALEEFAKYCNNQGLMISQALLVIGEMKELGTKGSEHHRQLGEIAWRLGFRKLLYVGEFYQDFITHSHFEQSLHFKSIDSVGIGEALRSLLQESSACLVKGSRSIALEKLFVQP